MPQIVEADIIETRHSLQRAPFPLRPRDRNCVGARSYGVPVLWKPDVVSRPLGGGQDPFRRPRQRCKQRQRGGRETDHLCSGLGILKAKTSAVQIDLLPPQRQDLAAARAGKKQELDRRARNPGQ